VRINILHGKNDFAEVFT